MGFREAREEITGDSWLDDLARMSLSVAEAKFSGQPNDTGLNPVHQIDRRVTYAIGVMTVCTCGLPYLAKFEGPLGDHPTDEQRQDATARADALWAANCPYSI